MSNIKVTNLAKKFSDFIAVSDLSFEISENKVLGFLGPNGAGKTTTLRMLVGLSKPTSGKIEIGGEEIKFGDTKGSRLVGYLPEQPSFYGWMTGSEYLNFIADLFGLNIDQKKRRIKELFHMVGLDQAKDKKVSTYSNGMKQRLGIAQALINDPKVLILDEPVSALDPIGRKEVLEIIEKLKKEKTILMSTHILSDVDRVCDDIVIINNGKLVVSSSLASLREKYAKSILQVRFLTNPEGIVAKLKKENWVLSVVQEKNSLKVSLKDDKIMIENSPLQFFAQCGIGVLEYGLVTLETEDLFLKLLEEK